MTASDCFSPLAYCTCCYTRLLIEFAPESMSFHVFFAETQPDLGGGKMVPDKAAWCTGTECRDVQLVRKEWRLHRKRYPPKMPGTLAYTLLFFCASHCKVLEMDLLRLPIVPPTTWCPTQRGGETFGRPTRSAKLFVSCHLWIEEGELVW
jgi:hypothetical protein